MDRFSGRIDAYAQDVTVMSKKYAGVAWQKGLQVAQAKFFEVLAKVVLLFLFLLFLFFIFFFILNILKKKKKKKKYNNNFSSNTFTIDLYIINFIK